MRIRLVVPADVDQPTGGNVYDLALAEALVRTGDQVDLVRCEPSDLTEAVQPGGADVTLVDGILALGQPRAVASVGVGLVVHMTAPISLAGWTEDRAAQAAWDLVLRSAVPVIATSHASARLLVQEHGLEGVVVAPPGATPAAVETGSAPPLLVHLAAVLPHKDQLGVVAALAQLTDLPWRARLAGSTTRDPAYAEAVREAVHGAGLDDRVEMAGVMSRDAAWSGADLALLPSRVESFGMVVTEALARGVPAVVSEGGPEEALGLTGTGERPGVLVRAGDPDGLAMVLRRWLTDPRHRDVLRGRALVRRDELEGWESTAQRVREGLSRRS
jgi:hypothetical protein